MTNKADGGGALLDSSRSYQCYKQSPYLSIKHSTYFPVYDRLFGPYVGKEIVFAEVGVLNGGSLFMWREFFGPKARIIGLDFNPLAERWRDEGFEIEIGDQADPAFWRGVFEKYGDVDLLLDDGGHTYEQQIVTVESALPHVRDGGLIVVEDTHTSYMPEFGGRGARSFIGYTANVVDGINQRFSAFARKKKSEQQIYAVQAFESIIAFEVDRKLCALASKPTSNEGEAIGARDYRYASMAMEDVRSQTERRSPGLFERLKRSFAKRLRPFRNRLRSFSLGRYFKY